MKILPLPLRVAAGLALAAPFAVTAAVATTTPPASAPAVAHPLRALLLRRMAMRRIARRLDLSPDQITKLRALRAQDAAAVRAVRSDTSLAPAQRRAKVQAILQEARTSLRSVLTPDQQTRLEKMIRHLRQARRQAPAA